MEELLDAVFLPDGVDVGHLVVRQGREVEVDLGGKGCIAKGMGDSGGGGSWVQPSAVVVGVVVEVLVYSQSW